MCSRGLIAYDLCQAANWVPAEIFVSRVVSEETANAMAQACARFMETTTPRHNRRAGCTLEAARDCVHGGDGRRDAVFNGSPMRLAVSGKYRSAPP